MNKTANRQAICDVLMELAETDSEIVALASDSRGSASMTPFFNKYPEQSVEVGIAEQNLVSIAAGLAHAGMKPYAFSPASFLSTRSYEQIKVDVAYSNTNVKLIGISGGVSYGTLGMSHHSAQDIAALSAIPNMRVYLPSDRFQTEKLIRKIYDDDKPAYIRIGRNPVEDIYDPSLDLELNKAVVHQYGDGKTLIVTCGELVHGAIQAAIELEHQGKGVTVLDMYCLKPFDRNTLLEYAVKADLIVTVEEHAPFGGLGSMVSSVIGAECPKKVIQLTLPDDHVISGSSKEVFHYYGLDKEGIMRCIISAFEEGDVS